MLAETFRKNHTIKTSCILINFPVFHFEMGDIDNDGIDDIAVGVIKSTTYDSVVRKRPFFFKIENGNLLKMWTGTSLSHPLINFKIRHIGNTNYLQIP